MSEEKNTSQDTDQVYYPRSSSKQLPKNYITRDGFLIKGNTHVSLAASGIIEAAVQGFLHVEETEEYRTG
ncbi:hypothetical protein SAMN02745975_01534 [Geosporobacter subterraneus DSM 17957]|uniref:Uncharacterized protein n=1 Tax=Geosporobacter subterraneus DSM 17957 TaxID=1121919 RepID=A0A1M6HFE4_9FIRM|nr:MULTISPECIES: hypothetical protein [Clostridia]SHJ20948.1 hypothetical protein SAMN02745975_01534 [Geosporobacter subterraneus DSM 17957]